MSGNASPVEETPAWTASSSKQTIPIPRYASDDLNRPGSAPSCAPLPLHFQSHGGSSGVPRNNEGHSTKERAFSESSPSGPMIAPPTPTSSSSNLFHAAAVPIPIPIPIDGSTRRSGNTHGPDGVLSPPTPAPSPGPGDRGCTPNNAEAGGKATALRQDAGDISGIGLSHQMSRLWADERSSEPQDLLQGFQGMTQQQRYAFLALLVPDLQMKEALIVSRKIEPMLRRDMLKELPLELALHCLSFVEDAVTLVRASLVSRYWNALLQDERTWKEMCERHRFRPIISPIRGTSTYSGRGGGVPAGGRAGMAWGAFGIHGHGAAPVNSPYRSSSITKPIPRGEMRTHSVPARISGPSFKQQYMNAFVTQSNWLHGGRVLKDHISAKESVVTAFAVDEEHLVVGMADPVLHVFDIETGNYLRALEGHTAGVWSISIILPQKPTKRSSRSSSADETGSKRAPFRTFADMRSSNPLGAVRGWGSRRTIVVSGGSDRKLRVWDASTGSCIHALTGHTSTIRCIKVLDSLPICVSGSRDGTLRVWDIQQGVLRHVLTGHEGSVRCLDVAGNLCVSGSYDGTARVWDVMTGRLIHILQGHFHHIYSTVFQWDSPNEQPSRIITGSMDASVRIWNAVTGECISLLQGHTSLVGQMQLTGNRLVTGGSDGRVILWDLEKYDCLHRICAHDNSITSLQFDSRFILSSSNDGTVKLWDIRTGDFIRELTRPCSAVWKVAMKGDRVILLLQRSGKTVVEFLTFRPEENA